MQFLSPPRNRLKRQRSPDSCSAGRYPVSASANSVLQSITEPTLIAQVRKQKRPSLKSFPFLSSRYSYDGSDHSGLVDRPASAPSTGNHLQALDDLQMNSFWRGEASAFVPHPVDEEMRAQQAELSSHDRLLIMPRYIATNEHFATSAFSTTPSTPPAFPNRRILNSPKRRGTPLTTSANKIQESLEGKGQDSFEENDVMMHSEGANTTINPRENQSPASKVKQRFIMGWLADCPDCAKGTEGHYGHIR